jgi:hypothetical protein
MKLAAFCLNCSRCFVSFLLPAALLVLVMRLPFLPSLAATMQMLSCVSTFYSGCVTTVYFYAMQCRMMSSSD